MTVETLRHFHVWRLEEVREPAAKETPVITKALKMSRIPLLFSTSFCILHSERSFLNKIKFHTFPLSSENISITNDLEISLTLVYEALHGQLAAPLCRSILSLSPTILQTHYFLSILQREFLLSAPRHLHRMFPFLVQSSPSFFPVASPRCLP